MEDVFFSPNRPVFSISDEAFDKATLEALYPDESKYEKQINPAKIGIGFTTHNRHDLIKKAVILAKKYTPDAKIVVVDDASSKPVENATYRFNKNVGIAKAKNKCLELLDDCDYIFLFDDDTYPAKEKWYEPYIKSGENHLMMTWHLYNNGRPNGHNLIKVENGLAQYTSPCGCMLYITKKVLETVGGMDEGFIKWGDEHVEWSNRIYNAGLTTHRYADVAGSQSLIYAADFYKDVESTVPNSERLKVWKGNNERMHHFIKSKEFKPYKENKNAVFASFFNHGVDVQRGTTWQADISKIMALIESVKKCNERIFIFHNCFTDEQTKFFQDQSVKFIQCEPPADVLPNMARWIVYDEYLQRFQNDFESLFFVDSTDVEMLRSPFNDMQLEKIYVGDEFNQVLGCEWMKNFEAPQFKHPEYESVISKHKEKRLLNCGIVGGHISIIRHLIHHLANLHREYSRNTVYSNDMAVFNFLAHSKYLSIIEHGEKVNTRFKKNEYNKTSWFKHK